MEKTINWIYADATMRRDGRWEQALTQIMAQMDIVHMPNIRETLWRYRVGSNKNGDALVWRIDHHGQVQSGHADTLTFDDGVLMSTNAGDITERLKDSGRLDPLYTPRPTLFGQHLLFGNRKPAIIVNDEFMAVYLAIKDDNAVYLAGDVTDIPENADKVFQGRAVTLCGFPEEVREQLPGMDITLRPALSVKVISYGMRLQEMVKDTARRMSAIEEQMVILDKVTYEELMRDYPTYKMLVDKLHLVLAR